MIEDLELLQLFKAESAEHLARLDDGLLRLEKTPDDRSLLEDVFRESHSLKGAARMLGLFKIENAVHGLESILNIVRHSEVSITADSIESMNVTLKMLRKLVQEEISGESSISETSQKIVELPVTLKPFIIEESENTPITPIVMPPLPVFKPDKLVSSPQMGTSENSESEQVSEPFYIETVRVETRKLDDLLTLVGELSVIEGRLQHRLLLMDTLSDQLTQLERHHKKLQLSLHGVEIGTKIAEALHLENDMLSRFGEQFKGARDDIYEDGARLEITVNTLEERIHTARLLPLSTMFSLFPRMVRDLAKQQNKQVQFLIEGGDIKVDKRILEEMKDPLMHLIRNSIDHGIESPEDRQRLGKTTIGKLWLRASRKGNAVIFEVRDDGNGLDLDAIKRVTMERGLHDAVTLAAMSKSQLQHLIFLPGFSTSQFITELSGRGVGMDVVRINVERTKGSIQVESVAGTMMSVKLTLPVSLAATRLLLARVAERLYGLPVDFVYTSIRVYEKDVFKLEGHFAVLLNNEPIIAARLSDLLELPVEKKNMTHDWHVCIVLQVGDERLGLFVDDLLAEEEVVSKPLGAPLVRVRNVTSLAILGSGEICAVLNPADLMRSAHKVNVNLYDQEQNNHHDVMMPSILLVEDSVLIRAMEKRILESGGYEVITAVDGVDALNILKNRSFAAVVTDIIMPNMDGLTLTERIRAMPIYKDLPIILVTSLASNEDKRRGLDLGANAYIPKPSFDQSILLETLKRLVAI